MEVIILIIAISSIGTATAIGLLKCIRKFDKSINVVGFDTNDPGYSAGSVMVDKFYKIPQCDNDSFIDELIKILKFENVDMFIPIHDFEIIRISENIHLFRQFKIIVPSLDIIKLFSDKYKATIAMKNLGILTPEIVDNSFKGRKILREKVSVGSKGIKVVEEDEKIDIRDDEMLQEYIEGEEYTVDIFCNISGKPILIIPRIRLEVKSGVATKVEIKFDTDLINICNKILSEYTLPGLSNIQFIKRKGMFYFIELNPRFGGMSVSSVIASYNYIGDFININNIKDVMCQLDENLKSVKWGSIVTRYYEEVIYSGNKI